MSRRATTVMFASVLFSPEVLSETAADVRMGSSYPCLLIFCRLIRGMVVVTVEVNNHLRKEALLRYSKPFNFSIG